MDIKILKLSPRKMKNIALRREFVNTVYAFVQPSN